eukprot:PhF_6_TR32565/c0_g1_i3/m.48200
MLSIHKNVTVYDAMLIHGESATSVPITQNDYVCIIRASHSSNPNSSNPNHQPVICDLTEEVLNDPLIHSYTIIHPNPVECAVIPMTPLLSVGHISSLKYYVQYFLPRAREQLLGVATTLRDVLASVWRMVV